MKEIWTARVEVLTPPCSTGNTKAFTNVVLWAEDQPDIKKIVSEVFAKYSWSVLGVENCVRAADCEVISSELAEQIETAKPLPKACIFGTLHYYPSRPA